MRPASALVLALALAACERDVEGFVADDEVDGAVLGDGTVHGPHARTLGVVALDAAPVAMTWAQGGPARVLATSAARGQIDVVTTCEAGGWCVRGSFFVGTDPRGVAPARVGPTEVVLAQSDEHTVVLLEHDANDPTRLHFPVAVARREAPIIGFAVGDYDGDGDDDLVLALADRVEVVTTLAHALGGDPEHPPAQTFVAVLTEFPAIAVVAHASGAIAALHLERDRVAILEPGATAAVVVELTHGAAGLVAIACDDVFASPGAQPLAIDRIAGSWRPSAWKNAERVWAGAGITAWRASDDELWHSPGCTAAAQPFTLTSDDVRMLGDALAWSRSDARILLAAAHDGAIEIVEQRDDRR